MNQKPIIEFGPEDYACELLMGVDFTSQEDMIKAVASVADYIRKRDAAMVELQKEMLPYLSHLPSCNLNNQLAWFEVEQALADTPEKYRDADYYTEIEEMNHKKKQCTCGLNELLTPKP